jgi:hypothetical protein
MLFRGEAADFGLDTLTVNGNIVHGFTNESFQGFAATSTSQTVFISDAAYTLVGVRESHGTASSSGTLQVEKLTGTQASGGGTNLLTGTISLAGAANTVLSGTVVTTTAVNIAAGDRVGVVFGGTMTSLANCTITLILKRR